MANVGRFVCVLLPFLLTLASLVAMLIGGLAGVTNKSLFMFEVNATNLMIPATTLEGLLSRSLDARVPQGAAAYHDPSLLDPDTSKAASDSVPSVNITGSTLGIAALYDVGIWGYCQTAHNGTRNCSAPAFNWAPTAINNTIDDINHLANSLGKNITWPTEVTDAFNVFETVTKWTEVVFIIAYIALGVELFLGLFATCSRVMSCLTFLVALVATIAVCGAAAMATAMAVVVVGSLEATAKWYGVTADFNTGFLATIWIGAACAIGAGFFWLFTICCCAPDHNARRSSRRAMDSEAEKLVPGGNGYVPLQHDYGYNGAYGAPAGQRPFYATGANRQHEGAYEPYAHANV